MLFADFLLDFTTPLPRQPGTKKTVQKIGKKKHGWHPFVIQCGKDEDETNDKKAGDGLFGFPIDRLKAWIAKTAEHHKRKKKHQWRQNPSPAPQLTLAFR